MYADDAHFQGRYKTHIFKVGIKQRLKNAKTNCFKCFKMYREGDLFIKSQRGNIKHMTVNTSLNL